MSIKTNFSIKDLENLSGVKAHTIRIWEKRYGLLKPNRSETNIRSYDLENLQRLLNVSVLVDRGLKVSKIAVFTDQELFAKVREEGLKNHSNSEFISLFKVSMLQFDYDLFHSTYNRLLAEFSFRDIFANVFMPLLEQVGFLWMTSTIIPAHEHFISTLIQQKVLLNIERVQGNVIHKDVTYVLFLPMNEIHENGLLYIHLELLLKGYKSIYLGPSVPADNLKELQKIFPNIHFVSYFTVEPTADKVESYVEILYEEILKPLNDKLTILGRQTQNLDVSGYEGKIKLGDDLLGWLDSV